MPKSVMQDQFGRIATAKIPRSSIDRSHGHKTTLDEDYLVPIFWDLAYPGDTFNTHMTAYFRIISPLKQPLMDNLFLETFFFAVPIRLVWDNWQKFCGEQVNPGDPTDYTLPVFTAFDAAFGHNLTHYLGISPRTSNTVAPVSLWHRA